MVVKRGKEALLLWCKAHTHGYEHVEINDFTTSWQNGMAFCALLHKFYPEMIDYASLKPANAEANLKLAFDVGSKVGIPILLEVSEVADANEASMLTYIAKYYWVFKDRTGSRVKLKSSSSTVSPVAPPKEASKSDKSADASSSSSSSSPASASSASASSASSSSSSSSSESSSEGSSTRNEPRRERTEEKEQKKLVGHIVPKDDLEYAEAVDLMVKQLKESIIPSTEQQISKLFDNKPFTIEVDWESFTKSLPVISDEKAKDQAKGNTSRGAREAWRAVRTLYDQNGKLLLGEVASVIEQFLSGHAELGKDIPERSFNKIKIENIALSSDAQIGDDEEETENAQKLVVEKRDTVIKDGLWLIKAPFSVKTSKGPFTRNELLVILLDLFGIVSGSENADKQSQSNADKNAEAKEAVQKKTWRQTRSLKEIGRQGMGGTSGDLTLAEDGSSGWQEGKAKSQLGELVWMEISIPAIARQLRVQYPLSTTIGQIKNYLKTQFAEEMQNLYALYAYELCHLRSVTSGGDDVWLLYADSNLHTYNIQNNDVLEFAMDEEQVQERKPIELEGYLQKEGQKGLMKLWKHRWFSTQDNRLLYFHSETSTDPVGFIPLTQIVSIGSSTHASHANNRSVFEIKTTQRIYYLLAECEEDKETWIAGLTNSMTYWKSNSMQWTQQWKEGFLVKRGAFRHNWLKRWFMLRDEFLFYYEAKDGSHYLRGKIPLYGVTVEEVDKKKGDSSQFYFNVTTAGRVFQLASETEEERRGWMRAIQLQGQLFSSRIDAITET